MPDPLALPSSRFAVWPRRAARAILALWLALLVAAAFTPIRAGEDEAPRAAAPAAPGQVRTRDADLQLYDDVIARLKAGEGYYAVIAEEHRRHRFPLHPGFAVRLPTLAVIEAAVPAAALAPLAVLLTLAVLLAWWRKLGGDAQASPVRAMAMAALLIGATIGTTRYFFVLHELWAGQFLALALGLHRPERGRWLGAWLAAALALAIREHALPFVLLMAAFALWQRRWREGAAWLALVALFLAAMAVHLHLVARMVVPADQPSASWITLRGLSGWLSMVVLSGNLRLLPHWLAGPLVVASLLGWSGWKGAAGLFGTLLQAGYGLAFAIAGRGDNYYWGMVVAPTLLIGLAFLPAALRDLRRSAGMGRNAIALALGPVQRT
ncbi:hypothetical protein ACFOD9_03015 [Novosphingobium bradum]|uniref:DUF2029 domain-containing protein n=1 Tax=Novosphingobium bradum TaxID=1737444 RepID=A0ABV7IQS1_9SPHN